jgi:uncharacterized membrane protein YdjX (TVP38/TMEM64 family)
MMKVISGKPQIRFAILLLIILALILLGRFISVDKEGIDDFLKRVPFAYSSVAFVFLYVGGTFFIWYLKDPLKIVGAIIFGAYWSTLFIYIAEIINAYLFFNISNRLGQDYLEKSLRGRFRRIYERIGEMNIGWIFLLRAVPLIPYRVLDLSFGLSKLSFKKYVLAVVLASLPRIFWIQFVLTAMRGFSVQGAIQYFSNNMVIFLLSLIYLVITLIVLFRIRTKFQ